MSAVPSHFSAALCPTAARAYRRRRPERTALYRLVQQHLETWLAHRQETDPGGTPTPRHVERELRGFLECGILACGFARAPPEPEAESVGSSAFAFDLSPSWDPTAAAPDPGFSFDQTRH